jgi:hypothetical protein
MTPEEISKLTDQELNELIAVKRGYVKGLRNYWTQTFNDSLRPFYCEPFAPNFTDSWKWAGELLEEMPNTGLCPALIYDDDGHWAVANDGTQTLSLQEGTNDVYTSFFVKKEDWKDSPTRAIAESWAMWSEQCG